MLGPSSENLKDITLEYKPIKRKGRFILTQTAIISMKLTYVLLDVLKVIESKFFAQVFCAFVRFVFLDRRDFYKRTLGCF
jgi:hypothetical protein